MSLIAAAMALGLILLTGTCRRPDRLKALKRTDLFELGYGLGGTQVDFSPAGPGRPQNRLRLAFRDGIFHVSSPGAARVMRLSAYGDLLALVFDPARSTPPVMNDSAFSVRIEGFSPGEIAVDSRQRIFVEDRLPPRNRSYNAVQGAWCERVVRRFGKGGAEEPWIGQEGPGGSPFAAISAIHVLDNDDLVVLSATETYLIAHRFGADGTLLNSLLLPRDGLPLPEPLAGPAPVTSQAASGSGQSGGSLARLHVYPDGMVPYGPASAPRVALKLDYVREKYDALSGAVVGAELAGSWIMSFDMKSAALIGETRLTDPSASQEEPSLRLLGRDGAAYILLESSMDGPSARNVRVVGEDGSVIARFRLGLPEGTASVPEMVLAGGSVIGALVEMPLGVKAVYWSLGSAGGRQRSASR